MVMTAAGMAAAIKSAIEGVAGAPTDQAASDAFTLALATGIVGYIQGNAVVTASGTDPQGGTQNVTGTVG
jgi:hypothetical protein